MFHFNYLHTGSNISIVGNEAIKQHKDSFFKLAISMSVET